MLEGMPVIVVTTLLAGIRFQEVAFALQMCYFGGWVLVLAGFRKTGDFVYFCCILSSVTLATAALYLTAVDSNLL